MVQAVWIIAVIPMFAGCVQENPGFADYWLTRDQQGRYLLERGDSTAAAMRFEDPLWRGVVQFEEGNFAAEVAAAVKG